MSVHIKPELIPRHQWDQMCSIIDRDIREALKNPENRADLEKWKREHDEV